MPRPLRREFYGAWCWAANQARRGEAVFADDADRETFLDILGQCCRMWRVKIAAWCLPVTRYELLLHTPEPNLSQFMRHLNGVYSQRVNRRRDKDGSVFKGRYKAVLIEPGPLLIQAVLYVHAAAVRDGAAQQADGYPWSSHAAYISKDISQKWMYTAYTLAQADSSRPDRARALFADMAGRPEAAEPPENRVAAVLGGKKLPLAIGSEEFRVRVNNGEGLGEPSVLQKPPSVPARERVVKTVLEVYGVSESDLRRSVRGQLNEPRAAVAWLLRMVRGDSLKEIAARLEMGAASSASSAKRRMDTLLLTDENVRNRLEKMRKRLNTED